MHRKPLMISHAAFPGNGSRRPVTARTPRPARLTRPLLEDVQHRGGGLGGDQALEQRVFDGRTGDARFRARTRTATCPCVRLRRSAGARKARGSASVRTGTSHAGSRPRCRAATTDWRACRARVSHRPRPCRLEHARGRLDRVQVAAAEEHDVRHQVPGAREATESQRRRAGTARPPCGSAPRRSRAALRRTASQMRGSSSAEWTPTRTFTLIPIAGHALRSASSASRIHRGWRSRPPPPPLATTMGVGHAQLRSMPMTPGSRASARRRGAQQRDVGAHHLHDDGQRRERAQPVADARRPQHAFRDADERASPRPRRGRVRSSPCRTSRR